MLVCVVLSCLCLVGLWSPAGKGLTSLLSCFVVFLNVSWSTSELRARLAPWNWFMPSRKIFDWQFQGGTSFVNHLCYLCLLFVIYCALFIAALWSPARKELTSWLLFMLFNCVFVTFPCGILGQVWYLIVSIPDLCRLSYFFQIFCVTFWPITRDPVCLVGQNMCLYCALCFIPL